MDTNPATPFEAAELRLALTALLGAVADLGPLRCARVMDDAARAASHAPRDLVAAIGAPAASAIGVRFEATRALNSVCAACGECPRGAPAHPERLMAALPPP